MGPLPAFSVCRSLDAYARGVALALGTILPYLVSLSVFQHFFASQASRVGGGILEMITATILQFGTRTRLFAMHPTSPTTLKSPERFGIRNDFPAAHSPSVLRASPEPGFVPFRVGGGISETAQATTLQFYMVICLSITYPTNQTPKTSFKPFGIRSVFAATRPRHLFAA